MSLRHILAPYVAPRMHPSDTGLQALLADCKSRPIFGPVPIAAKPPKSDGVARMIEREILAAEAKHLRNLSRCREASACEAKLRAVTLGLLRGGHEAH